MLSLAGLRTVPLLFDRSHEDVVLLAAGAVVHIAQRDGRRNAIARRNQSRFSAVEAVLYDPSRLLYTYFAMAKHERGRRAFVGGGRAHIWALCDARPGLELHEMLIHKSWR